jgi:hypothetical protein
MWHLDNCGPDDSPEHIAHAGEDELEYLIALAAIRVKLCQNVGSEQHIAIVRKAESEPSSPDNCCESCSCFRE